MSHLALATLELWTSERTKGLIASVLGPEAVVVGLNDVRDELKKLFVSWAENLIRDVVAFMEHGRRRRVSVTDVYAAAFLCGSARLPLVPLSAFSWDDISSSQLGLERLAPQLLLRQPKDRPVDARPLPTSLQRLAS